VKITANIAETIVKIVKSQNLSQDRKSNSGFLCKEQVRPLTLSLSVAHNGAAIFL